MARKTPGRSKAARWDIERLVASFGGIEALIAAHAKAGFKPISYGKVHQWMRRGRVPQSGLAEILLALRKLMGPRKRLDVWQYIVTD